MAKEIYAGTFTGRIVDCGIRETKGGEIEPVIRFKWDDADGDSKEWNWRGSLKDGKAREFTLKTLIACGFTGDDLSVLCDGSAALNTQKEFSLVIAMDTYNGKTTPKINYINDPDAPSREVNQVDKETVKRKLVSMNIANDLKGLRSGQKKVVEPVAEVELPF